MMKFLKILALFIFSSAAYADGGVTGIGPAAENLNLDGNLVVIEEYSFEDIIDRNELSISNIGTVPLLETLHFNGYFKDRNSGVEFITTLDLDGHEHQFIKDVDWNSLVDSYSHTSLTALDFIESYIAQ